MSEPATTPSPEDPGGLRRQIATVVNHELRTPLSTLLGHAELLGDLELPDQVRRSLDLIVRAGEQIRDVASAVSELVELDAATSGLEQTRVDLVPLTHEVVAAFASRASRCDVTLRIKLPARAVPVMADGEKVRQALVALVKTALQHAPCGSVIDVALGLHEEYVGLCVTDRGVGIAADQASPSRRTPEHEPVALVHGRGIGLAVADAVAVAHRGELRLSGHGPAGLTARLVLPREQLRVVD